MSENIFEYVNKNAKIYDVVLYFLGGKNIVKQGKNYKCICPFHNDHHPSMSINVERNIYKCFTCGAGGGPITFVSKYKNIPYFEALKEVVKICKIDLPSDIKLTERTDEKFEKYKQEYSALKELGDFYSLSLSTSEGEKCINYLTSRGIDKDIIQDFSLGYAPADSSLSVKALSKRNYSLSVLQQAGILSESKNLDRFSDRLTIPLKDEHGRIIAFASRVLDSITKEQKYINYPETNIFIKRDYLFNLNQADLYLKKEKCLYVVEGYMDVIALYKAGIKNAVALMTSNITPQQILILKKKAVEIRMLLDSDDAGQKGIERSLLPMLKENINVKVVVRFDRDNEGKDPDEVISKKGKDYLLAKIKKTINPFSFIIYNRLNNRKKITSSSEINDLLKELEDYYPYLTDLNRKKNIDGLSRVTDISSENLLSYFSKNSKVIYPKEKKKREEKIVFDNLDTSTSKITNSAISLANYLLNSSSYKIEAVNSKVIQNEISILIAIASSRAYYEIINSYKVDDDLFQFSYFPFYIVQMLLGRLYQDKKTITKDDLISLFSEFKKVYETNTNEEEIDFSEIITMKRMKISLDVIDKIFVCLENCLIDSKRELIGEDCLINLIKKAVSIQNDKREEILNSDISLDEKLNMLKDSEK